MKSIQSLFILVFFFLGFTATAQSTKVNTKTSTVAWLGKKIGGQHEGFIQIKSGELNFTDGNISTGNFTLDMGSITCTDLKDETYNDKLIGHLKSDDFFSVDKFQTASLNIIAATKFTNERATVTGEISIKGHTETVKFDVVKKGNVYTAQLNLDRSSFDVRYGSNSFFDNLGDKAIDDVFTLDIKLVIG